MKLSYFEIVKKEHMDNKVSVVCKLEVLIIHDRAYMKFDCGHL